MTPAAELPGENRAVAAMDGLYRFCIWVSGLAIAVMSLIIPWGIFTRYVLGTGSQWPEPVAILLMVVFTFFGAAAAYRAGAHIAVGMLTDALPDGARRILAVLADVLVMVLCVFLVVWGGKLALETMNQTIAEIPWMPVGVTYLPLPAGALVTLAFVLEKLRFGSQHTRDVMRLE